MIKKSFLSVSLAAALMCAAGGARAQGKPDKAAQTFITKAVQGNLAEVSMGQLAQKQGDSAEVKSFGQQLVADHSAANQKATAVAGQLGVKAPSEPSKKQMADHHKLMKLSGAAFDRQFATMMNADHKKAIADYKKAAKMKNDAVAGYATESLPVLEKHLQTAQAFSKAAGKGGGKSSKQPSM